MQTQLNFADLKKCVFYDSVDTTTETQHHVF